MDLRGFAKFSLVDYPGKIAAIVFSGGCNLRCPFCHNPCLVLDPTSQPRVTEREFFKFLDTRRNLLEGVVVSGGEPTLQKDLAEFVSGIKERGFLVKLDTNGTRPEVLEELLKKRVVDDLGIPVIAYGLRADFQGNLFEGSRWLLAWADSIEEIKTVCWCGKKATFNARVQDGKVVKAGDQIMLGGNESYTALCRKHWAEGKLGPDT